MNFIRAAEIGSTPAIALGDPEAQAFLDASIPASGLLDDEGLITIQRSETGAVRMVFGTGFRVPLSGIGCTTGDLSEGARCFLRHFQQAFRLADPDADLVLLKVRQEPYGERVALFNQQYLGYPVFGRQVLVTISPSNEVTHVYSTLAVPLASPDQATIQSSFATADASQCLDAARDHLLDSSLRVGPTREVLWPALSGDTFVAVPALSMSTFKPGEAGPSWLTVVDVESSAVLESRSMVASYPPREMWGYARHPAMSPSSSHPTCSTDIECSTQFGPGWACSADFSPRRCFKKCSSISDCDFSDYDCFLPGTTNPELGGYCHWVAIMDDPQDGFRLWSSSWGWYNSALADHLAYDHLNESLNAVVSHHVNDMGLTGGYDEDDGTYWVNTTSQCYGCQYLPPEECDCSCEYSNCPGGGSVNFGTPQVSMRRWKRWWASTTPYDVATSEKAMGHEWGHVLIGAAYGWQGTWPPGCVGESSADTYGALFGVTRLGGSYAVPGCGGFTNTPYWDDRAGLNPGCKLEWLKSYAYRSRFDLLDCDGARYWYTACSAHSDCPAYQVCEADPNDNNNTKCTNWPVGHNGGHVFFRLVRILSEGAGAFYNDGHREDLGIPHSPLGLATTIRIMNYANRRLSSTTTLKDWMNLILSGGSYYGKYAETYRALGASGFFPNQSLLTSNTTDRDPIRITFPAWYYSSDKSFVIWKESGGYNLKVWYNDGGTVTVATIAANTLHRPAAVVHGNYLHIYYRDRTTAQIKVQLIHYNGWFYGPYNVDPGPGQLRPTGAFEAVRYQNRVYLVFADSLNSRYLTIARCNNSVYCAGSWHDFGGGTYKKVVLTVSVLPGMSAVAADNVRGRGAWYTDIYIAAGEYYGGRVFVTRVNADDSTGPTFYIPTYYPSYTTITGLGIEARQAAFPYYLAPFWYNQNYLYLVWKHRTSSAIYTAVLQDATSSSVFRFTKSQPAFYDAKTNTGVSWAKGNAVTDNIQGVFASPSNSMIYQFNGYGRY